jgi:23S rRNA pseudouridine2604 synthase
MNSHTPEGERLSKRVMQLRGCSRREAEQYIEGGWVSVDGVVVEEPQSRVSTQTVTLDSQASLMNLSAITLIVNKPAGWLDGLQEVQGRRKSAPQTVRSLLDAEHRSVYDASGVRLLKRHFHALEASVPLETGASGLVVFTQDFRTQRKLIEDMAFMEHELVIDVRGEVVADDLRPIERALKDERLRLPFAKVSVGSATPERSKLRLAVKGAHPGFAAYLCELAKLEILALRRIRLGRVSLSDLEEGTWRYLALGERF